MAPAHPGYGPDFRYQQGTARRGGIGMFKRKRSADDFAEEIKAHLELEADELKHEGIDEDEARRRAHVAFGNESVVRERFFLRGRWESFDKLVRDLHFSLRSLAHSAGFAAAAILTLALGIGA